MSSQSVLHAPHSARDSVVAPVVSVLGTIATFFTVIGQARNAQSTYERLMRLSDAELAAMGLNRNDLARYAFDSAFDKR